MLTVWTGRRESPAPGLPQPAPGDRVARGPFYMLLTKEYDMLRKLMLVAMMAATATLGGCLPIELDVSPDGQVLVPREEGLFQYDPATGKATQLAQPADGQPAFALYIPESKDKLLITGGGSGGSPMGGSGFTFNVLDPRGKSRVVYSGSNVTYASVSPDGKHIGISRVSDQQSQEFEQNMPELLAVNLGDGTKTAITSNASALHRWMPDGRHLLVLHLLSKDSENDLYTGQVALYNLEGKQTKVVGTVVGPRDVFLDLSPNGKKLLCTATAFAPGSNVEMKVDPEAEPKLHLIDMVDGEIQATGENIDYGIWSPDGDHILIGGNEDDGTLTLRVTGPTLAGAHTVAEDAAASISGGFGPGTDIYPGWVDDDTIHYLAKKSVYGTAGKNLFLTTVNVDGSNRRTHQHHLDAAANK